MIAPLLLSLAGLAPSSATDSVLDLDAVLRLAVQGNPDLERSRAVVQAAEARLDQAQGALLPTVTATTDYSRLGPNLDDGPRSNAAARMEGDAAWKSTLGAKWVVFDGFRSWQGLASLSERDAAARASDSATEQDVRMMAAQGWANLWVATRRVEARFSSLNFSRLRRGIAKDRFAIGSVAGLEATQASIEASRDSLAWIRAVAARATAARDLNLVLGRDPSTSVGVSDPGDLGAQDPVATDAAVEVVDLRAARLLERAASRDVRGARGGFWPEVSLYADYTWLGTLRDDPPPEDAWNEGMVYGARATWLLFEGGRNLGRIREASATYTQAKVARTALERSREASLALARSRWETAKAAVELESTNDTQTETVLKAAMARYQAGDLSGSDLRRYQDSRLQARLQFDEARAELLMASLALRRASGRPIAP
jgi:outer membrane protein TolC